MATNYRQMFSDAQRQQALADSLMQRSMQPRIPQQTGRVAPQMGMGEGLAQLGEALLARRAGKKATTMSNDAETARRQAQSQALYRMSGQPNMVGQAAPTNPFGNAQDFLETGGDPSVAKSYLEQQAPGSGKSPFGVVNPSDFTPESLRIFAQSQDYGDLVPRNNMFGRYNPRDYTTDSWAQFVESGDPSSLVRTAPSQFRPTAGGGVVALDPLNPANPQTVISDQAGTDAAAARAQAEADAKARGEASGKAEGAILSRATNAQGINDILDIADPLIDEATGSGSGAIRDKLAAFFGESTEGDQAIGQLRVLQAAMMLAMPRMEGPQSDRDVILYQQAAAELGDPNVPRERKKAAVSTIRELQKKYMERAGTAQETPAAEGLPDFSKMSVEELRRLAGGG